MILGLLVLHAGVLLLLKETYSNPKLLGFLVFTVGIIFVMNSGFSDYMKKWKNKDHICLSSFMAFNSSRTEYAASLLPCCDYPYQSLLDKDPWPESESLQKYPLMVTAAFSGMVTW